MWTWGLGTHRSEGHFPRMVGVSGREMGRQHRLQEPVGPMGGGGAGEGDQKLVGHRPGKYPLLDSLQRSPVQGAIEKPGHLVQIPAPPLITIVLR